MGGRSMGPVVLRAWPRSMRMNELFPRRSAAVAALICGRWEREKTTEAARSLSKYRGAERRGRHRRLGSAFYSNVSVMIGRACMRLGTPVDSIRDAVLT